MLCFLLFFFAELSEAAPGLRSEGAVPPWWWDNLQEGQANGCLLITAHISQRLASGWMPERPDPAGNTHSEVVFVKQY